MPLPELSAQSPKDHPVLARLAQRAVPGSRLVAVRPLGAEDRDTDGATTKSTGYGAPLELTVRKDDGDLISLVFRTATANAFGHDWRADRAAEMILAFDTFSTIPDHVAAIDIGALGVQGDAFVSLRDTGEFYLLTHYEVGEPYASDLRHLARTGALDDKARRRSAALSHWLAELHVPSEQPATSYVRSLRDVIGSGEGIFGIIDGYPPDVPAAPPERLQSIEARCVAWRWRLRSYPERLCRIHGDFHPFNVLFDGDRLAVLDASRGSVGDPANDVACMAVNYIFFALEREGAWTAAFRELWMEFWRSYLADREDRKLLDVVAPYLAWRILVLCNPAWYPALRPGHRDRLLALAEHALRGKRFDPEDADRVFCEPERTA